MKIVYIAHPIGGDVENNLKDLRRIIRKINLEYPDIVPFVPYYSDVVSLNDAVPEERARGFKNNKEFFMQEVVEELWLTGGRISSGMQEEFDWCIDLSIPVFHKLDL